MAPQREPPKTPRPAREQGTPSVPLGAQAENLIEQDQTDKASRARRQRAAQEAENSISVARSEGKSTERRGTKPKPTERQSGADPSPRAVPEHVNARYVRVGDDYHFPGDGGLAWRDHGDRLSTKLENTEVIRDFIAVAQERGWDDFVVKGSERFRKTAWQEAQAAGLNIRNYEASELEREQLARRLGRARERDRGQDAPTSAATPSPSRQAEQPEPTPETQSNDALDSAQPPNRVYRGRLLDHGEANYNFDPREEQSFYVLLETPDGEKLLWGKDLERALEKSLSKARENQEVVVRQVGAKPVTVRRPVRDEEGVVIDQREVKTYLNRWLVETKDFLNERARLAAVVRDVSINAKTAVAKHPELAGTYGELHAARLVALHQNYSHPADIDRFVDRTRENIAQEIERGEPLSAPLDRARYRGASNSPRTHQRAQERVL
jgi:hypothetical protein